MKTKIAEVIAIIIMIIVAQIVFPQGVNYKIDANNNGTNSTKFGFTNNAPIRMVTRDSVRQTITSASLAISTR